MVHGKNGVRCLLQTAPWPAAFFKMQTRVVIAKLLRNLSGTDSRVGLGGNWIPLLADWLLENPRPSIVCGPRGLLSVGIWAVGA